MQAHGGDAFRQGFRQVDMAVGGDGAHARDDIFPRAEIGFLRHGKAEIAQDLRVKAFLKSFKFKGPVFEISALNREGCESLVQEVFKHIQAQQTAEQEPEYVDPRFIELSEVPSDDR